MGQLTDEMIRKLGNFRQDIIDALTADLAAGEAVDAVSASGACSLTRVNTELSVSGTKAYTLAAPTRVNQRKVITCVAAASTPAGTLTVSSPDDTTGYVCAATFFFDAVGQEIELQATSALKWRCIRKKRVGAKTLTIGTTVTTGICDMSAQILCSVTGTVASLTTKGIPNGSAVGERISVVCSVAGSTPHGDIAGTFVSHLGAAATALDDLVAVGDGGNFVWNGSAWQVDGVLRGSALAFT